MFHRSRILAFDLSAPALITLQDALPEWTLEVVGGATAASLPHDPHLGGADHLVLMAGPDEAKTLGMCRELKSQPGWSQTPLLVLVKPDSDALVTAALKAGADHCLILPLHANELVKILTHAQDVNQPGRHTLNLDQAQTADQQRDDGGEA